MKRLLLLGVGSALMFTMGGIGSAQADTYGTGSVHKSTAVTANGIAQSVTPGGARCAACHRAHTAKAEYLLKQAQPGLCYTCHGGAGSFLDVVDGKNPTGGGALRGGGFAYSLINGAGATMTVTAAGAKSSTSQAGTTATAVTSRHQIDGVTQGTMWGNGAISETVGAPLAAGKTGVTLECGSCHDPHGNGNYRILKAIPNDAATKEVKAVAAKDAVMGRPTPDVAGAPDVVITPAVEEVKAVAAVVVAEVKIPDVPADIPRKYTTADYWVVRDTQVPAVDVNTDATKSADMVDGYILNVAAWCTTCHTRYLAGSGSWKTPLTDAGGKVDATFTYRHRGDSATKGGLSRPNCIQCHVSHGTSATMTDESFGSNNASLAAPDGSTPATGLGTVGYDPTRPTAAGVGVVGNSRLLRVDNRGTCKMCHNV